MMCLSSTFLCLARHTQNLKCKVDQFVCDMIVLCCDNLRGGNHAQSAWTAYFDFTLMRAP